MATNLTGFNHEIFGSQTGPDQMEVFGSFAATGTPTFTTDPEQAQSLSNWLTGWAGAVIGGNAPTIEDANAVNFVLSYLIAYILQKGVPEWHASRAYFVGGLAMVSGVIYVCVDDAGGTGNIGHAVTDPAWWARYGARITQYTTNQTIGLTEDVIEFDASSGPCNGVIPAANAVGARGKKYTITKMDSSANPVVVNDGTNEIYRLFAQYDSVTLISNGSIWYAI